MNSSLQESWTVLLSWVWRIIEATYTEMESEMEGRTRSWIGLLIETGWRELYFIGCWELLRVKRYFMSSISCTSLRKACSDSLLSFSRFCWDRHASSNSQETFSEVSLSYCSPKACFPQLTCFPNHSPDMKAMISPFFTTTREEKTKPWEYARKGATLANLWERSAWASTNWDRNLFWLDWEYFW